MIKIKKTVRFCVRRILYSLKMDVTQHNARQRHGNLYNNKRRGDDDDDDDECIQGREGKRVL